MAALGKKLRTLQGGRFQFHCPGCDDRHAVDGRWTFNGNGDYPTFSPSIKVEYPHWVPPVTPENIDEYNRKPWEQRQVVYICHSFVTDGCIQFLGDCTHRLAGQTVDLPDHPGSEDGQ